MFNRIYLYFKFIAFRRKAKAKNGPCQIAMLEQEVKILRKKVSDYYLKNEELQMINNDLRKEVDSLNYLLANPSVVRTFSRVGGKILKQAV